MKVLAEAQAEVLDAVPKLEARRVGIREALGLVLVDDVTARHDLPPFANSAMDGYAVRSADVRDAPVDLPVVDEVAAGAVATQEVLSLQCSASASRAWTRSAYRPAVSATRAMLWIA